QNVLKLPCFKLLQLGREGNNLFLSSAPSHHGPFPSHFVPGICTAYHESKYESSAVGPPNTDGSQDYGVFQINSRYWCDNQQGETANGCRISCSAFTNDDITDDIECAKTVVRDPQGMDAWVAWKNHCKGKDLSEWTAGCSL
uniref:Lysozyme C, milk isozyme-like n=1 Tax=Podarcis muralis TaxID=64176 RepID=A0A670J5A8_PODMU